MVNIVMDGRKITAQKGATLLAVARDHGIEIPTLCAHQSLDPSGSCRMCVVEVLKGKRTRIVTSCIYQAEDGLIVDTKSERVLAVRRLVLQLLMARCPESELIREMAAAMGVKAQRRFVPERDRGKCILCRMCVKTCESVVGALAIGLCGRGHDKAVGPPFLEAAAACIGCGACVYVCPTGHIEMRDNGKGEREIWGRTFKMAACVVCGRRHAPVEQLAYISRTTRTPLSVLEVCLSCR